MPPLTARNDGRVKQDPSCFESVPRSTTACFSSMKEPEAVVSIIHRDNGNWIVDASAGKGDDRIEPEQQSEQAEHHRLDADGKAQSYEKPYGNSVCIEPRGTIGACERLNEISSKYATTPSTGLTLRSLFGRAGGIMIISQWRCTESQLRLVFPEIRATRHLYQMLDRCPNHRKNLALAKRIGYREWPNHQTISPRCGRRNSTET